MGWSEGRPLGKEKDGGITEPVSVIFFLLPSYRNDHKSCDCRRERSVCWNDEIFRYYKIFLGGDLSASLSLEKKMNITPVHSSPSRRKEGNAKRSDRSGCVPRTSNLAQTRAVRLWLKREK